MKKLLKTMLVFIMVAVIASCSDEEATVAPVKEDNIKTDTKISIEQARQDLLGLLSEMDSETARSYGKLPRTIKEGHSFKLHGNESRSEEAPNYYVFNFDNNQGYAIMSGDERIPSLIALTDSGSFNENDSIDNPGLEIFFSNLKVVDDSIKIKPNPGGVGVIDWGDTEYKIYGEWQNQVYKKRGYCTVKWGQHFPYNWYVRTDDGKATLSGCAATAIGQLMSIYKYPKYYDNYSFQWDIMTAYRQASMCSYDGMVQVAKLMEKLGLDQNLDMTYTEQYASASPENIIRTFKSFGYSKGGVISKYSISKIENEIANGFPLLAYGCTEEYSNIGHIWLIHGLLKRTRTIETRDLKTDKLLSTDTETEWYPLCNWGNDGNDDGYYLSFDLNANKGPKYDDDMSPVAPNSTTDNNKNYRYRLMIVTEIRK